MLETIHVNASSEEWWRVVKYRRDAVFTGYDGGSSDSECESPTLDEQECQARLMPDFWLIVKIHQDRVTVYSHSRSESFSHPHFSFT